MIHSIQLKGGSALAMAAANPLLAQREIAVEVDTGKIKVGNGFTYWNDLPYSGGSLDLPDSDDTVYVIKNGAFVNAVLVDKPSEWNPSIDESEIFLTLDMDMTPYQLNGSNVEVNL